MKVWIDGGCRNNGAADAEGYASVKLGDVVYRIDLPGAKTNNQAELGAFLAALQLLWERRPLPPIELHGDSQYVAGLIFGTWKAKENKGLVSACREGLRRMREITTVTWVQEKRDAVVEKLGH